MTFQPPPPPPGPPPGPGGPPQGPAGGMPPPPPGQPMGQPPVGPAPGQPMGQPPAVGQPTGGASPSQWGPPPGQPARPGGGGAFDPKTVHRMDWVLIGIGVLLLLFSFFDYYTVDIGGLSDSASAWHFGSGAIIGWLAFIAGLAGAVVAALSVFMPTVKLPVANYVAALGLFALSALLYILGFFIIGPDDSACLGNSQCENAIDDAFGFGFSYWASLILVLAGIVVALMRAQQTGAALPGALGNLPTVGGPRPGGPSAPPR